MPSNPEKSSSPTRLKGRLLLADPSMRDGVFDHAVVLITDHSPEAGAYGVILNHPEERTVGDLLQAPEFAPLRALHVFHGGPVAESQLSFASFSWQPTRGLCCQISLPLERAIALNRRSGTLVRAFVGHSGWSPGQLESELARKAWVVVKPDADLLGREHSRDLWVDLMSRISPFHRILSVAPECPWLN